MAWSSSEASKSLEKVLYGKVENSIASTSPPYWDTYDDDCGEKHFNLYGRYTWKIGHFSRITKRELRSNTFEVGGHEWYILIYPQGCDVCDYISLFLCAANHEKLLPGWSHLAQFTVAVINKDPKQSKYSDTLHSFWKKEHDWGWKKFMPASKVSDGFLYDDTLTLKAQVQVIRPRVDRPFVCLDRQYRRELINQFGAAMALVKTDVRGNISRLENKCLSNPAEFQNLYSMVKVEVAAKKAEDSSSCTNGLLWLTRAMDFILELFRNLMEHEDWAMSQVCSEAYTKTLKKFHGWLASSTFTVAMKLAPDRKKFMDVVGGKGDIRSDIEIFCATFTPLLEENHKFLECEKYARLIFARVEDEGKVEWV